jgi:hypothetical protein
MTMQNMTVRVFAQREENYGAFNDVPCESWKMKGSQEFTLSVNSEIALYAENEMVETIKEMLNGHSDFYYRYTYLEHQLVFSEPITLDAKDFATRLEASLA